MGPLIPLGVIILVGVVTSRNRNPNRGVMTPERCIVFDTALAKLKDPSKLTRLADAFEKEGLKPQAEVLRKRAALSSMAPELKRARRVVIRKALASKNVEAVNALSDTLRQEGATGAADMLQKYATGLAANIAA